MSQFARPASDISAGSWTPVGASYLWDTLNETSYNDSDYSDGADATNSAFEVKLSSLNEPDTGTHTVRFRAWQENNTKQRTLLVQLICGSTVISEYNSGSYFNLVKGTPTAYNWSPTSLELEDVTDWTDLRLRFTSGGDVGTPAAQRSQTYVSWAEYETPDGGGTTHDGAIVLEGQSNLTTSATVTHQTLSGEIALSGQSSLTATGYVEGGANIINGAINLQGQSWSGTRRP